MIMMMMGMMMVIMMLLLQGCRWSCALALRWCPPLQPGHAYCIHLQASPAAWQPGSQSGMHSCMPRPLANVTPTRNAFYLSCMRKKKITDRENKKKRKECTKNALAKKAQIFMTHCDTTNTRIHIAGMRVCVCICIHIFILSVVAQ